MSLPCPSMCSQMFSRQDIAQAVCEMLRKPDSPPPPVLWQRYLKTFQHISSVPHSQCSEPASPGFMHPNDKALKPRSRATRDLLLESFPLLSMVSAGAQHLGSLFPCSLCRSVVFAAAGREAARHASYCTCLVGILQTKPKVRVEIQSCC